MEWLLKAGENLMSQIGTDVTVNYARWMFHQVTVFWLDYLDHVNEMWMVEVLRTQVQRALSLLSTAKCSLSGEGKSLNSGSHLLMQTRKKTMNQTLTWVFPLAEKYISFNATFWRFLLVCMYCFMLKLFSVNSAFSILLLIWVIFTWRV